MTQMPPNSPTDASTGSGAGTEAGAAPSGMTDGLRSVRRSQSNRVIAGVLGGLGRKLDVDPLLLRIVTAVLVLFGGVGILLYAIAWLLIPAEDEPASVLDQAIGRRDVRDAAAAPLALALGAVIVISSGVVIGASWSGRVLLILAGAGLFLLLRQRSEPSTSTYAGEEPASDVSAYDHGYQYDTGSTSGAWTPRGDAGAEDPEESSSLPPSAGSTGPVGPASSMGPTGPTRGWPDGPDWGVPSPERSPYDDLYLHAAGHESVDAEKKPEQRARSVLGLLTFCTALVALGVVAIVDATLSAVAPPVYVAVPLAVVAVGLLVGTWYGRSRGLIVLGSLLTLALVPVSLVSVWDLSTGPQELPPPTTVAELPDEPLTHGAGPFTYDLSQLQLSDDDDVSVTMRLGMGVMTVTVPEDADVVVNGAVGMGEFDLFGHATSGIGREQEITDLGPDGAGGGRIEITLELGMGSAEVIRAGTETTQ